MKKVKIVDRKTNLRKGGMAFKIKWEAPCLLKCAQSYSCGDDKLYTTVFSNVCEKEADYNTIWNEMFSKNTPSPFIYCNTSIQRANIINEDEELSIEDTEANDYSSIFALNC